MSDNDIVIRRGRAYVRLIEAAKVLLGSATTSNERVAYGLALELAVQQLRQIVLECDPPITAQIMVASERVLGTVKDVTLN